MKDSNDMVVAEALAGQSEDYLTPPTAACFVALGMDEKTVTASLKAMAKAGEVEYVEVKGEPVEEGGEAPLLDAGWRITAKGRKALADG